MSNESKNKAIFSQKTLLWAIFIIFIISLIPLVIYFYKMNNNSLFHYVKFSSKGDDWSDFGSLLSGVFTLSGSFATLATLVFAMKQNNDLKKERDIQTHTEREYRDKQTLREESLSSAQKTHMIQEQEKMRFEKFQLHREMFNDTLNNLELRKENKISFINRTVLYRNIFPNNNFNHCDFSINSGIIPRESILAELSEIMGWIIGIIQSKQYEFNAPDIFSALSRIHLALGIQNNNDLKNGDIYIDDGNVMFNVFYLENYLDYIHLIINELRIFAGFSGLPLIRLDPFDLIELKAWSVKVGFWSSHSTEMVSGNSIRFYTDNKYFTEFMRILGDLIKAHKFQKIKIPATYSWIMNFLTSADKIKKITTGTEQGIIFQQLVDAMKADKSNAEKTSEPLDNIQKAIDSLQNLTP